tara:strand:+ start:852 stop:1718 length:867 start_codon:yes stop_codon:yes gene_type:complete
LNDFIKYLEQPYLYYYKGKKLVQISLLIFALGFFFNYVIEPFEINYDELKLKVWIVAFIHTIVPLVILYLLAQISNQYSKTTENWTVKKELLFIFILLLLTGIGNYSLRDILYNNPFNHSINYLFEEVFNTLVSGFLLAFSVISANLNIQYIKNSERASELNLKLKEHPKIILKNEIEIETELKSETFKLAVSSFIFAKAEGNYIEIWTKEGAKSKASIKRMKLKEFEKELTNFSEICKTHRSYLLNITYIENVKGNAQGYKIKLKNCDEQVPVSRNYLALFNDKINQ